MLIARRWRSWWRGGATILVAVFTLLVAVAPTASAAPAKREQGLRAFDYTQISTECTVDTPALAALNGYLYLFWTGCDNPSHIWVRWSSDGITWPNSNRATTCAQVFNNGSRPVGAGPAVTVWNGRIYVANAGTDHHLWLGYFQPPTGTPSGCIPLQGETRYADTTSQTPALTSCFGNIYLAWTGDDGAHHLNVETTGDAVNFYNKTTLSETSSAGPGLSCWRGPDSTQVYIAWSGTDANSRANVGYYTDLNSTVHNKVTVPYFMSLGDVGLTPGVSNGYGGNFSGYLDLAFDGGGLGVGAMLAHSPDGINGWTDNVITVTGGQYMGDSATVFNNEVFTGFAPRSMNSQQFYVGVSTPEA